MSCRSVSLGRSTSPRIRYDVRQLAGLPLCGLEAESFQWGNHRLVNHRELHRFNLGIRLQLTASSSGVVWSYLSFIVCAVCLCLALALPAARPSQCLAKSIGFAVRLRLSLLPRLASLSRSLRRAFTVQVAWLSAIAPFFLAALAGTVSFDFQESCCTSLWLCLACGHAGLQRPFRSPRGSPFHSI